MCSDTADCTGGYHNSNFLSNISMSPSYILPICNVSIFFVGWSFIRIFVMLFVTKPSHLQNKWVKADTLKSFVICDATKTVLPSE